MKILTVTTAGTMQELTRFRAILMQLPERAFQDVCKYFESWFGEDVHGHGRAGRVDCIMNMKPADQPGGLLDFLEEVTSVTASPKMKILKASTPTQAVIQRATARLEATHAGWWEDLSPEARKAYIKQHPNSKKAAGVGKKKAAKDDDSIPGERKRSPKQLQELRKKAGKKAARRDAKKTLKDNKGGSREDNSKAKLKQREAHTKKAQDMSMDLSKKLGDRTNAGRNTAHVIRNAFTSTTNARQALQLVKKIAPKEFEKFKSTLQDHFKSARAAPYEWEKPKSKLKIAKQDQERRDAVKTMERQIMKGFQKPVLKKGANKLERHQHEYDTKVAEKKHLQQALKTTKDTETRETIKEWIEEVDMNLESAKDELQHQRRMHKKYGPAR